MRRKRLLLAMLILSACERPATPPFLNEGVHAGMTLQQIDSIARRAESRTYRCLPVAAEYRECWLRSPHTNEFFIAVLDGSGRVIIFRQHPDLLHFRRDQVGRTVHLEEANRFRRHWRGIATPEVTRSGTATVDNFLSTDRKWGARVAIDVSAPDTPYVTEIVLTDAPAARAYYKTTAFLARDSANNARASAIRSEATTLMRDALNRIAKAQNVYRDSRRRYAKSLRELHHVPERPHDLRIMSAGEAGWWARIKDETQPALSCYIWSGATDDPIPAALRWGTYPDQPYCRHNYESD